MIATLLTKPDILRGQSAIDLAIDSGERHSYHWWTCRFAETGLNYFEPVRAMQALCHEMPHLFIPAEDLFPQHRKKKVVREKRGQFIELEEETEERK
jgi:hypothetical protein